MAAGKRIAAPGRGGRQTDPAVAAYLDALKHPHKPELETLRLIILGTSPAIREGIKWNSPSFRTTEWFATISVHAQDRVRLILHLGAKVKDNATKGMQIADPGSLLEWLAKARCLVTIGDVKDLRARRAALQAIVRQWIRCL